MKTPKFTIGSKWQSLGSRKIYEVIDKRPFGHIAFKQVDKAMFLETYQSQARRMFIPYVTL